MARSTKKGPFIDAKLLEKVNKQKAGGERGPIKTWARASQIPPDFVGHTFAVHNGRIFINVLTAKVYFPFSTSRMVFSVINGRIITCPLYMSFLLSKMILKRHYSIFHNQNKLIS